MLRLGLRLTDYDQVLFPYRLMRLVSDYVVRYGAQGILLTGIVCRVWTNWGFFRDGRLLEAGGPAALTDPVFVQQQAWMQGDAIAGRVSA